MKLLKRLNTKMKFLNGNTNIEYKQIRIEFTSAGIHATNPQWLLKSDSNCGTLAQVFSCEFCKILKITFRTPLVAAFVTLIQQRCPFAVLKFGYLSLAIL